MTKVKLVLLGMLAVFAVSAVASASASAALETRGAYVCANVGSGGQWKNAECSEKESNGKFSTKELGTEAVEGTSETSELAGKIGSVRTIIICKKDEFSGSLLSTGASSGEVKFRECVAEKENEGKRGILVNCKVKVPIEFKFTDQLLLNTTTGIFEDEFKATKSEETFVEITIEETGGTCTIKGEYKAKGTQNCELPKATLALVTHEIVCKPEGSNLKLGAEPAKFKSTEKVKLSGGQAGEGWAANPGQK
jgi:hypothetical protein